MVGADVAPFLVEETTVIETMIVEEMENGREHREEAKGCRGGRRGDARARWF